ncbi:unnamed protein product [Discosporangium mesarthrocarpum]
MGLEYACGDISVDAEKVVKIVRDAGVAIMDVYKENSEDWGVQIKTKDNSPLTKADLAANKIICDALAELYPGIPIVSEENKLKPFEERQKYTHFFCVDPLDGTKASPSPQPSPPEFIKRNGQFTVNVGLCEGDEPVLGVVGVPAAADPRTYFAVKGGGAYVETDTDKTRSPIQCKSFSEADEGLCLVASASHSSPETEAFIAKYKNPSLTSMGSSLKLLLVAEGKAHVYPRLAPTSEWDTCASHAIVSAAGGEVLQHEGGKACEHLKPVVYNKEEPLNPFFVVYGSRVSPSGSGLGAGAVAGAGGPTTPSFLQRFSRVAFSAPAVVGVTAVALTLGFAWSRSRQ